VLLGGVAVAMASRRFLARRLDAVALMKCVGAQHRDVLYLTLMQLAALALAAGIVGTLLGFVAQYGLVLLLDDLVEARLPGPAWKGFLIGPVTALTIALGFALPPLLHLKNISPMRVIRRDLGVAPVSQWLTYGAAAVGALLLLIWYSESLLLTLWTLLGAGAVLLVFAGLAWLLLRGGRVLGMQAGSRLRLALSGLQRRRRENIAQYQPEAPYKYARCFCKTCGTNLFYRVTAPGPMQGDLHAGLGLLDDPSDITLTEEIFIDRKPKGYAFAGATKTLTEADVFAMFAAPEGHA